jgi:glycosyltransferase involved in cell wall biosynthesis
MGMAEKFDVWICTFNSAKLLPKVSKRLSEVIPSTAINKKFIVDDFSSDATLEVAKNLGWQVYKNKKKGLYNARRYAFSLVESRYCACFEHDILLARNWYPRIPNLVMESGYDVAQGIRIRDTKGFQELDIYDNIHRKITSEDNTFYSLRQIKNKEIYIVPSAQSLSTLNYYVDKTVCSLHLRGNVSDSLRHGYTIYRTVNGETLSAHAKCLVKSLPLSLKVGHETGKVYVVCLYPLERLMILSGAVVNKALKN